MVSDGSDSLRYVFSTQKVMIVRNLLGLFPDLTEFWKYPYIVCVREPDEGNRNLIGGFCKHNTSKGAPVVIMEIHKVIDAGIFSPRKLAIASLAFSLGFWGGCKPETDATDPEIRREYETGKNYYTTEVDGDVREYYVHVPSKYNPERPTAVVFMLHGTSGNGEKSYNISGWKEVGEVENILTVYPSSWRYCIIDKGKVKNTTKWTIYPGGFEYCSGETPRNDIKFLRRIITELKQRFNVDRKRIYLAGFSNGGAMAGRCAVEMSDEFAAVAEASGTLPKDTTFVPRRKLPVMFQLGNSDDLWLGNSTVNIPMGAFDSLLTNFPLFRKIASTHTTTFGMDSTYTLSGNPNSALIATYKAVPPDQEREFKFVLIKGLEHNYPNGKNHPLKGAELHWDWMKQYALP